MLDSFSHYLFEYFFSCTLFLHFLECPWYQCWMCCCCCSSTESCLTLCDPMGCSTLCSPVLYYLRSLLRVLFIESVMLSYMTVSYSEAAFFCLQSFTAPEIFCYHSTDLSDSAYFFSSLFSFYCEDWIISKYLSLFIHSLLSPNYSWAHPLGFYFSYCIFQPYHFQLVVSLIIYIPLLRFSFSSVSRVF